jgi:hypothetical protein
MLYRTVGGREALKPPITGVVLVRTPPHPASQPLLAARAPEMDGYTNSRG